MKTHWWCRGSARSVCGPSVLHLSITRIYPPSIMNQSSEETWFDFLFHHHHDLISIDASSTNINMKSCFRRRRTDLLHHLSQQGLTHVYFLSRDTNTKHRIADLQKNVVPTDHSQDVQTNKFKIQDMKDMKERSFFSYFIHAVDLWTQTSQSGILPLIFIQSAWSSAHLGLSTLFLFWRRGSSAASAKNLLMELLLTADQLVILMKLPDAESGSWWSSVLPENCENLLITFWTFSWSPASSHFFRTAEHLEYPVSAQTC